MRQSARRLPATPERMQHDVRRQGSGELRIGVGPRAFRVEQVDEVDLAGAPRESVSMPTMHSDGGQVVRRAAGERGKTERRGLALSGDP